MSVIHRRWSVVALAVLVAFASRAASPAFAAEASIKLDPHELAKNVTIYRDSYGMPHIDGKDDKSTLFGFGYCQAEDYFWQIEDSYVMGLGRYCELYGKQFLGKDMRNRAFEIPQRSKEDYEKLDPEPREGAPHLSPASTTTSTPTPRSNRAC